MRREIVVVAAPLRGAFFFFLARGGDGQSVLIPVPRRGRRGVGRWGVAEMPCG